MQSSMTAGKGENDTYIIGTDQYNLFPGMDTLPSKHTTMPLNLERWRNGYWMG